MININLLPWREEEREKQNKHFFFLMALVAALTIAFVLIIHVNISSKVTTQLYRNGLLETEINTSAATVAELREKQKKQEEMQAKLDSLIHLNNNRFQVVRVFNDLAQLLPKAVYLTQLKWEGNKMFVTGVAQNNMQVAQFLENITTKSQTIAHPELEEIALNQDSASDYGKVFQLQFQLK